MSELKTTGLWHDGDKIIERRTQDVEPVLEDVKARRAVGMVGGSEMRHAARIPTSIIETYIALTGITLHELMSSGGDVHWKRILNDPDLSGFRVWQGRA